MEARTYGGGDSGFYLEAACAIKILAEAPPHPPTQKQEQGRKFLSFADVSL